MARRTGRGRLSSIDLLPAEADEAVQWALQALSEKQFSQAMILERFNEMLAELDPPCGPISRSAFNRHSMRFAAQARRLTEAREAASALAERLDDMPAGDVGLMLGETIKTLINDVILDRVMDGESPSIKDLRDAAEALQRTEMARKAATDTQAKARDYVRKKATEALSKGVEQGTINQAAAEAARRAMGFS